MYEDNMNTNHNSTAMPSEIDEYTSQTLRVLEVVKAGRLEISQRESEEQARQAADAQRRQEQRDKQWEPIVAAIKNGTPEWMHPYLTWNTSTFPHSEDEWVKLDLPECMPILAYTGYTEEKLYWKVAQFKLYQDEDDNEWYVPTWITYGHTSDFTTLASAVATAHDRYGQYLEACDKAAQRNAETHAAAEAKKTATPAATSKPVQIEIPMDPAAKVLAAIAELDLDLDTVFERGLLYGLITIATELRAIRDGIDDIAAVVVANDPKSQENNQ